MFFFHFFPLWIPVFNLLISCGFWIDGRSYPTPAGRWLPFSWPSLPLRVQSSITQIAHRWIQMNRSRMFPGFLFSDVRFIIVIYLDYISIMVWFVFFVLVVSLQCFFICKWFVNSFDCLWFASVSGEQHAMRVLQWLLPRKYCKRPSISSDLPCDIWRYRFGFKASTFDNFALGNGHCEGRGSKTLMHWCINVGAIYGLGRNAQLFFSKIARILSKLLGGQLMPLQWRLDFDRQPGWVLQLH